jgi:23S rRNA (uridine2552-2'-O)-methyltransferase
MNIYRNFSRWMDRHVNDGYVKKSVKEGYRSRSAYKLLEINEKFKLIKPCMNVIDLGSSPGGWSQVVTRLSRDCKVVSVDLLPMEPISNVKFFKSDIRLPSTIAQISDCIGPVDLILSDMSPNHTGLTDLDCSSLIDLHASVLVIAKSLLKLQGTVLVKMLDGPDEPSHFVRFTQKFMSTHFKTLSRVKPKSSRKESKELYYIGIGWVSNKI